MFLYRRRGGLSGKRLAHHTGLLNVTPYLTNWRITARAVGQTNGSDTTLKGQQRTKSLRECRDLASSPSLRSIQTTAIVQTPQLVCNVTRVYLLTIWAPCILKRKKQIFNSTPKVHQGSSSLRICSFIDHETWESSHVCINDRSDVTFPVLLEIIKDK